MKPHHKTNALIGIPVGLAVIGTAYLESCRNPAALPLEIIMGVGGAISYIWGCLSYAKAKGYSPAIVFTVVLGVIFPVVVLLALPDKHRRYRRRRE